MKDKKNDIEKLKSYFETKKDFNTSDIANFYRVDQPELKISTVNWRIYNLVQNGIIERVGKGVFRIGKNNYFYPELDLKLKTLHNKIQNQFPVISFCIWKNTFLDEFTRHHSSKNFTIIEAEKEVSESIYYFIKENNKFAFFNPSSHILEEFIFNIKDPIIIKSMISEAPLQIIKDYQTVTLEKMLVDVFCDEELFFIYQGKEMRSIFKEAFEKYSINTNKLLRYASRRGKKEEINKYINQIIGNN